MPLFIIERHYAEQLDPGLADIAEITRVNEDEEVRWLMSFLSADKRKTYCLYEGSRRRRSGGQPSVSASLPTSSPRSLTASCPTGHSRPSSESARRPCRSAW